MKKWKAGLKRIVAVALAVLLVGNTIEGSSFAVYAAEEGEDTYIATRPTALYVGGIEVDVSEEPTGTISGDTWGYDYGTNTLTVTGDIAIGGSEAWWDLGAIEPRGDLNIKVTEDAVLTGVYGIWNDPGSTNIIVNEGVTLTLNVTGAGISASGDVTLSGGGTLKAIISSTGGYEPILVYGDLKVSNMTINTAGGQCSCLVGSGGNYTIENSQVTFPNGIVHDSDEVNITNSIITEGTTTTVYGEATLRETLTIGSGETINFKSGASITNMDSLTI